MTETQREPVPRVDDRERATALASLQFARHCVLKKTEGLDDAQLRTPGVPSGASLLGLVQHLTDGERYWSPSTVAGEPDAGDADFEMDVTDRRPSQDVLAAYRTAADRSDAILGASVRPSRLTRSTATWVRSAAVTGDSRSAQPISSRASMAAWPRSSYAAATAAIART
jgi:hypothetical protein